MIKKQHKTISTKQMVKNAEQALQEAVKKVIDEHRRSGKPVAVWRDGKVVKVHPEEIGVHETGAEYGKSRKGKK
jgi:hypothetical protein